jgi:hypothetical protein
MNDDQRLRFSSLLVIACANGRLLGVIDGADASLVTKRDVADFCAVEQVKTNGEPTGLNFLLPPTHEVSPSNVLQPARHEQRRPTSDIFFGR